MAVDLFAQVKVAQRAGFKTLVDIPGKGGRGSDCGKTLFLGALRKGVNLLRTAHSIVDKI